MIDFQNAQFVKLRAVNNNEFANIIFPMFVQGLTGTKKRFYLFTVSQNQCLLCRNGGRTGFGQ